MWSSSIADYEPIDILGKEKAHEAREISPGRNDG